MLLQSLFGLFTILSIAYLLSEDRPAIEFKTIITAIIIHVVLTALFLRIPWFQDCFLLLNRVVSALEKATVQGSTFVFGYLGGGTAPFEITRSEASFILAFQALPIILTISALTSLLYHYRILPVVVQFFSYLLQKSLGISGAVGLSAAANAFVGMVEAPLFIKPYLKERTRGELFSIMVGGMATIAGTVMVLYAHILSTRIPNAMGHILTASVLNVFSALIISLLMIPHRVTVQQETIILPSLATSGMDAIVKGTADGVMLLINIIAMLLVLVALVNLVNQGLDLLPYVNYQPITLQRILGILLAPLTFLIGIPVTEIMTTGALMGTKIVLNELIAYIDLANLPEGTLEVRSKIIMLYAMCGFANLGSLGIMVGGLTVMCPAKGSEIVSLGTKSITAGVLATCFTATVVSILL